MKEFALIIMVHTHFRADAMEDIKVIDVTLIFVRGLSVPMRGNASLCLSTKAI